MPRPSTKETLIELSREKFSALNELIHSYSEEEKIAEFPQGTLNRNIRDVLAHLLHWHLLFLSWYEVGMKGEKPEMPAKGYSWKDTPALNLFIWEKYQSTPLQEIMEQLGQSYQKLQLIIEKHSDTELFEKKRFKWTGSTSMGAYLISEHQIIMNGPLN
jgi:hypothetical protein